MRNSRLSDEEKTINMTIRRLLEEKERKERRCGSAEWVKNRLYHAVELELESVFQKVDEELQVQKGFSREAFEAGEASVCEAVREAVLSNWKLSREQQKNLKNKAPEEALEGLLEYLQKKKLTEFWQTAGVDAATWGRFLRAETYMQEKNIEKIVKGFSLTEAEERELHAMFVREYFSATAGLKKDLYEKMCDNGYLEEELYRKIMDVMAKEGLQEEKSSKKTEIHIPVDAFLKDSRISQKKWGAFRINSKEQSVSQGTLLQMIIGLQMAEADGTRFLQNVNSDFIMYRDCVVLACIRNEIKDVDQFIYYLDHYNGQEYLPRYKNPYAKDGQNS